MFKKPDIPLWDQIQIVCLAVISMIPYIAVAFVVLHFILKYW